MTLGEKLKLLRIGKKMKQREMAGLLGVNVKSYGSYEENRASPAPKVLLSMSRALGLTMEQMLDDSIEIEMTIK